MVPAARTYQQSDSDSTRETGRMTEPLEPPSYDEIVAHLLKNGVSKSQLQESCGDFLEISSEVADWKLLARHFGLDKGDVVAIGLDETDEATRRLRMFETWKQKMGHKATYYALIKVFVKAGKAGFIEGIQKVLTRQGQQGLFELYRLNYGRSCYSLALDSSQESLYLHTRKSTMTTIVFKCVSSLFTFVGHSMAVK